MTEQPDRLTAMREAAAVADADLAALDAFVKRLRAADPARDAVIDPERSWARIEQFLESKLDDEADPR